MRRVKIFSSSTEYMDWMDRNCLRCIKYDEYITSTCELDYALAEACMVDGTVSEEIARRVGFYGNELSLTWDCPERIEK